MNNHERKPLDIESLEAAEMLECVYTTLLTTETDQDKTARAREHLQKALYWLRRTHEVMHGRGAADAHVREIDSNCPIHGDEHRTGPTVAVHPTL